MTGVRRSGLPTSAVRELEQTARRTLVRHVGLALCAVAVLAVAVLLSTRLGARPTSYFASGGGGVIVLDLSTSVEPAKYRRIQRVLRSLAQTSTRVGLVVFSDDAYEMLTPGTRGDELRPLLLFFEPPPASPIVRRSGRSRGGSQELPSFGRANPWTGTFRGGTKISVGLGEARRVIERDGIEPAVLLISDLDDSALDTERLTQELIRYEADGIDLRVVPLFAFNEDRDLFEQLVGEEAFVQNRELLGNTAIEERQTLVGSFPAALVAAAAALLALLALNERFCGRVSWRRA
ncbi:MAG: VWA domain-containing protein [Gaiellaceae bacterium MAG52_C11]|nr:VWA domain-containing protein [Candidatus Gaiellasilicea maunaloa]